MHLTGSMRINRDGHLEIGGIDTVTLAQEFGTPLWVIDEEGFRSNCRCIKEAFTALGDAKVVYACKSLCTLSLLKIVEQEGLGIDVVSGGELYTALQAGFPMDLVYFHGNNKSLQELEMAVENGVGRIVVDNLYELEMLNDVCSKQKKHQDILLRITPGIEAHTHHYIMTGQIDSKFGFTLPGGQAMNGVKMALEKSNLNLVGLHCHIGSQIFEMDSFKYTAAVMVEFMGEIRTRTGCELSELDLGGGLGIFYADGDEPKHPSLWAEAIMTAVQQESLRNGIRVPQVIVEPGRAIVSPAGITLYTVGSIKEIDGIRKYAAVDGGMADNPRPALYNAKYHAILANKANEPKAETVSVAGKCCESGDLLIEQISLPRIESGDILAVFATGAYNYSMSSNYNQLPRPAMVLVKDGKADIIIRRQTYEDLIRNDILLARLAGETGKSHPKHKK
ncbi:MAG: diaminopimelate decarboxylase [Syntrophomonadaceae bacterium]|jgi:diaminopimelate decarboxylase